MRDVTVARYRCRPKERRTTPTPASDVSRSRYDTSRPHDVKSASLGAPTGAMTRARDVWRSRARSAGRGSAMVRCKSFGHCGYDRVCVDRTTTRNEAKMPFRFR
jgi:hypothetical protein